MALKDIKAANNAKSELAQAISPTDTSFIVNDASVFPDAPFRITIDKEIMEVGTINKSTNTFSDITRGVEGTTATNHDKGASVENRWTAGTLQILLDNIQTTFTRVVDGKRQLAAAIGDMNQSVASDVDFAHLAAKIRDISKDATATPGYVARGKTFYANGKKQTGTYFLDDKPWRLITPTTSRINVSGGYYPDGLTVEGDTNLRSGNILSGKSIFGVRGNVIPGKYNEGSVYVPQDEETFIYVGFRPDIIVLSLQDMSEQVKSCTLVVTNKPLFIDDGTARNGLLLLNRYGDWKYSGTTNHEVSNTGISVKANKGNYGFYDGNYKWYAWKKGNM